MMWRENLCLVFLTPNSIHVCVCVCVCVRARARARECGVRTHAWTLPRLISYFLVLHLISLFAGMQWRRWMKISFRCFNLRLTLT